MDDLIGSTIVDLQRMICDFESEIEEPTGSPSIRELNFYIDTLKHSIHLLETQEPKTVQIIGIVGVSNMRFANCPWCGARIHDNESQNYCGRCGKAVKWDAE